MLSTQTLERAFPLTQRYDAQRKFLIPAAETPLAALVSATRSDSTFNTYKEGEGWTPAISDIDYIANQVNPATGVSDHDAAMGEVISLAAEAVSEEVRKIKTVVAPAVRELAEKTAATLANIKPSDLLGMEVVVYNSPKPLFNTTLEREAKRWEAVPFDNPRLTLQLPPMTGPELFAALETGTASIDNDVKEWAAGKGETFFLKMWSEVFEGRQPESLHGGINARVMQLRDYMDDLNEGTDYALAIYLLASRLWDKAPAGVTVSATEYEKVMSGYRDQAASVVAREIDKVSRILKEKQLVRRVDGKVTYVNGEVYKEWIEAGGSNEMLFGNSLTTSPFVRVQELDDNKTKLLSTWSHHDSMVRMSEAANRYSRTKETLRAVFMEQLAADVAEGNTSDSLRLTVIAKFEEQLQYTGEQEMADLYMLSVRLLCRSRFLKSDAERFLTNFNRIKAETPNISDDEVATLATVEYVADWVASQIEVRLY